MFKKFYLFIVLLMTVNVLSAQKSILTDKVREKDKNLIQFSGVVVESDNLLSVPYASIIVKHTNRGTISDYFGYFSFVAKKNDTLEFSAIGHSSAIYIIPDSLTSNTYSLIQVLSSDTVLLKSVQVYPWPSKENFKQAFLNLDLSDSDYKNATKNLERSALKSQMAGMAADASLNYKYAMQERQSKLYYAGQYPPNNLLNPIAWAKFIKAWKNGDFNKKE